MKINLLEPQPLNLIVSMCKICKNQIHEIKKLDCNGCPSLTQIPLIQGLKELWCSGCKNLTKVQITQEVDVVICYKCPKLNEISVIESNSNTKGSAKFVFWACHELVTINVHTIQELHFISCHGLINIQVTMLKKLVCQDCRNLKKIPFIEDLQSLRIEKCNNLIDIPYDINCSDKNVIQDTECFIDIVECKWLDTGSDEFGDNLRKLIFLQKWVKKMILRKRLIKLIPKIIPLYYAPEHKGGYFHKKEMHRFIDSLI